MRLNEFMVLNAVDKYKIRKAGFKLEDYDIITIYHQNGIDGFRVQLAGKYGFSVDEFHNGEGEDQSFGYSGHDFSTIDSLLKWLKEKQQEINP